MWKPVRGASSYEVQVSPDPPGTWSAQDVGDEVQRAFGGFDERGQDVGAGAGHRRRRPGAVEQPGVQGGAVK